jgi:hypothetical protein
LPASNENTRSLPRMVKGTEMYWYCGIFLYESYVKKIFFSLRDCMVAECKIFTCLFTGNLACNFLSVKSPYQLSRGLKLMSLLVTRTGCMLMYQPVKKHLTAKVSVMSTDFHSNLINCWQSRSRSYFVVEWTVLHLQRTCGFMTQFPWGWTRLTLLLVGKSCQV